MRSDYLKGLLLTATGVFILSFDALLIRLVASDEFSLLFWRGVLLSLIVTLWVRYRSQEWHLIQFDQHYLCSAFLFALSSIFFVSAIHHTSVANVLVIICAQPLFAAIFARIMIGERSPPVTWVAILICIGGIIWVIKDSWSQPNLKGDLLALACALSLSAKFVNDRAVSHRDMSPALILSGIMIGMAGFIFGAPLSLEGESWGWMILLCGVVIPIAFVLITLGPTRIPAAEVGMLMLLETICGPLLVWLFLHEVPSESTIQGGVLILLTLLLHSGFRYHSRTST